MCLSGKMAFQLRLKSWGKAKYANIQIKSFEGEGRADGKNQR